MRLKVLITWLLLLFVVASVGYLALRGSGGGAAPGGSETAAAPDLPPVAATPAVAGTNVVDDAEVPRHQVLAYYLHNSVRCPSCMKIEKYTTNAVNKYFADELESGELVFQVLNTDDKPHQHFVKDYSLVTKSVILADMHDGKQTRWVNLEEVWDLLGDEEKFGKYIEKNLRDYLNEKK